MQPNQFLFKIELDSNGNPIELDNMSLGATEAFIKIANAIVDLLKEYENNSDNQNIRVNIYKSSAALSAQFDETTFEEFESDFEAVSINELQNPAKILKFRKLQNNIAREEYRMSARFISNEGNNNVIDIFRGRKFKGVRQNSTLRLPINKFEKVFLNRIGGDKASVEVWFNRESDNVTKSNIRVKDIDLALGLRGLLYTDVYLLISLENRLKLEITDMYQNPRELSQYQDWFNEIQSLDGVERYRAFSEKIRSELSSLSEINDKYDVLYKHSILFLHKKIESGMIRTILMILKPYKSNHKLGELFDSFVELYKKTTNRTIA